MRPVRVLAAFRHPAPYRDPLFDRLAAVPGIALRVLYLDRAFAPTPWAERPLAHEHAFLRGFLARDVAGMRMAVHPGVVTEFARFRPNACILPAWSDPSVLALAALCRLADVPYALCAESFEQSGRSGLPPGLRTAVMRWAIAGAAAWLPAGTRATDHLVRHGAARLRCHPFPTNPDARRWTSEVEKLQQAEPGLRASLGLPRDGVVTFVGRLVADKAPDVLLEAHALLRATRPGLRLVFLGDGPERRSLEARAGEGVEFRGFLQPQEVLRVLACSDVLALPSRYETWGAVACEALAAGVPVVLSDRVGSATDLADGNEAARVVPVDDAGATAEAIRELLDHAGRRTVLSAEAKRRAAEWGHELGLRSALRALVDAGLDLSPEARGLAEDVGGRSGAVRVPWSGRGRPLAYVSDGYPNLSQTFTLAEVRGLAADGVRMELHSLHRPRPQDPPLERRLDPDVLYLPVPWRPCVLASAAWWAARRPALWARLLLAVTLPHTTPFAPRYQVRAPLHLLWGARLASRMARGAHVHAQFCGAASTVAWVAARLRGAPFSFTEHADWGWPLLGRKLADSDFALAISEHGRQRLLAAAPGTPPSRVILHRLGVQLPERAVAPLAASAPYRLLSVGTAGPTKGHEVLAQACAILRARGMHLHLVIVGGGPMVVGLGAFVRGLGLGGAVTLLGDVPHARVLELLRGCHAFVLACRTSESGDFDGIPVALMEAMAHGRPVVSTTVSGIPELVQHERTGLAVPPDRPDLLAAAIDRLARDPSLAARLAEAGRRHVAAEFDAARTRRRLAALFHARLGLGIAQPGGGRLAAS